tara:strand:+ start:2784 stop:3014 length:231 start_codon:yes stop_codon:yes gene_type:complete
VIDKKNKDDGIIAFPQSRTSPRKDQSGFKELGISKFAQKVGKIQPNLKGHWCSNCKGIWYGLVGEAECPECGNRNG